MRSEAAVLLLALVAGCTTVRTADGGRRNFNPALLDKITFEHGCSADRVVLLRESTAGTMTDLDVCGRVRRYECGRAGCSDVTNAFPPDVLPQPVQPPGGSPPPPAPLAPTAPSGPERCEALRDCTWGGVCIDGFCRH